MKITIKQIAKLADVSIATVSMIVNKNDNRISQQTRERVLAVIEEYGYIPNRVASSMITKKTKAIGLIIPDITNPFFPKLARGVEDIVNREGYTLILCNSDNNNEKEDAYIEMLREKMVDGIIFTATSGRTKVSSLLRQSDIPFITVDRDIEELGVHGSVCVDNEKGAFEAVQYLISRGYKTIIHLSGPMFSKTSSDRYKGYLRAHKEAQLEKPASHLIEGSYSIDSGYNAALTVIKDNIPFDSFFCGNDLIAIGAIKVLKDNHFKIPNDIGVVGYDDINMATIISPELTTVSQPIYELGFEAANLLIKMIKGEEVSKLNYTLETKLTIRESTK